jgi:hypothetical protein
MITEKKKVKDGEIIDKKEIKDGKTIEGISKIEMDNLDDLGITKIMEISKEGI